MGKQHLFPVIFCKIKRNKFKIPAYKALLLFIFICPTQLQAVYASLNLPLSENPAIYRSYGNLDTRIEGCRCNTVENLHISLDGSSIFSSDGELKKVLLSEKRLANKLAKEKKKACKILSEATKAPFYVEGSLAADSTFGDNDTKQKIWLVLKVDEKRHSTIFPSIPHLSLYWCKGNRSNRTYCIRKIHASLKRCIKANRCKKSLELQPTEVLVEWKKLGISVKVNKTICANLSKNKKSTSQFYSPSSDSVQTKAKRT